MLCFLSKTVTRHKSVQIQHMAGKTWVLNDLKKIFFRFLNFILHKPLLGVAYLWCREYVRNPTAGLTTRTLIKLLI